MKQLHQALNILRVHLATGGDQYHVPSFAPQSNRTSRNVERSYKLIEQRASRILAR